MKDKKISKIKFSLLFPIVLLGTIIFSTPPAQAIPVEDIPASIWRTVKDLIGKTGSQIFNNALRTTVNQLAYDYATYLGSGAAGQKPFFEQKPLGERMIDAGDAAFGEFIEEIGSGINNLEDKDGNAVKDYQKGRARDVDICSPDLTILNKIALGLTQFNVEGYKTNACSFRNMKETWQNEYDQVTSIVNDKAYLQKVGQYFSPGGNDLTVSLELFGEAWKKKTIAEGATEAESKENKGWLRVETLVGGRYVNPPDSEERALELQNQLMAGSIGKYTGNVLVDAANIFLNQLAITAFNKLMRGIGSSSSSVNNSLTSQYAQGNSGGVQDINRQASELLQARFNERTDYDILGQLSSCDNEETPGPTSCVITQQFAQAIEQRLTIGEAIQRGIIDDNKRIGFDQQGREMSYNDGYPYRSLIILRKYRILPVGWELAAQYIKDHAQETKDITLKQLIECFSPSDSTYSGYSELWCEGLIDPNWVLKANKQYCGMEGYGSEIVSPPIITSSSTGYCTNTANNCNSKTESINSRCISNNVICFQDTDCASYPGYQSCNFTYAQDVNLTRNNTYCADEQSCIKENPNGSCDTYGYCTEEKRQWIFNFQKDNSCEAINNTCQVFEGENKTAAYLENTLDFSNCGPNQVGCKQYALTGTYNSTNNQVSWNTASGARYLNKNAETCDPDNEGCHQFIRVKDDNDTNIIADGSFEGSQCIGGSGNETLAPKDKFNIFVKSALAQIAQGSCTLATLNNSGTLPSPNNHWYIRVNSGSVRAGITNEESDHGSQSLYIEGSGGLYSKDSSSPTILPSGFSFEADRFYTLSAMVYVTEGKVRAGFGTSNNGQSAESTALNSWQNLIITYYRTSSGASDFYIEGTDSSAKFYIDAIKLSVGAASTTYSDYFANNVIYQKLLPNYLESTCYEKASGGVIGGQEEDGPTDANYKYKANAPEICYQFARKCNADEVGCEKYTSTTTEISVTGKVKPKDLCPGSCVGYDVFVEQPSYFSASSSQYFIPQTARTCSAQATGCTAFTNLDKLDQGGEAIEYYSYLRTCMKPDTASCGEFYTWEGSDDSGYQLQVYSLKKDGEQPASTMSPAEEALVCNEEIFKKTPNEVGYNHDCREFYGRDGTVSYHLYSYTISCSDDCHPYRREVASSQECTSGGGTWDAAQGRCLHYSIPGQGTTCSAAEVGCREYTGNIANNTQVVLNDSFEDSQNPTDSWSGATQSNTSLNLGGHSLLGANLEKTIGNIVQRDQSYTITFLAKVQTGTSALITNIDLINKDNESSSFGTSGKSVGVDWKLYTFNLGKLDHEVTPMSGQGGDPGFDGGERLRINFAQPVYIDNIKLTEVPDRYYLIKDSWTTPDECDQTITGAYSLHYMLGCSAYNDSNNQSINLHSFSQLCQDSAAGCEQMIDTRNSGDYKRRAHNDTNNNGTCDTGETDCFYVPADTIINVVYDPDKQCGEAEKGCSRLGQAYTYAGATTYTDIYKEDNPDTYNTSLCTQSAVGCEAWEKDGGVSYFKDPGDMVCEWRLGQGSVDFGWFRTKVKKCGGLTTGKLCQSSTECAQNQECSLVTEDEECPSVTPHKTLGQGGVYNRIVQPNSWVGACRAEQSSCSEYIDPVSSFNPNIILNPSYKGTPPNIENWTEQGTNEAYQMVVLDIHSVYIIKGHNIDETENEAYITECTLNRSGGNVSTDIYQLNNTTNNFDKVSGTEQTTAISGKKSVEFYIAPENNIDTTEKATCKFVRKNRIETKSVELRQAVVNYQLAKNLDRTTPNGLVSSNKGYILFNERSQSGINKAQLKYNADETMASSQGNKDVDGVTPKIDPAPRNANVILSVKPDRVCSKWLSCNTYLPDPNNPNNQTCLDIGLCDALDSEGNCKHFIQVPTEYNQDTTNLSTAAYPIANLTGYSKLGYRFNINSPASSLGSDYYNLALMAQTTDLIEVRNGSFEENGYWLGSTNNALTYIIQPRDLQQESLNPFYKVKAADTSAGAYLPPAGKGIGKLDGGTSADQTTQLSLVPGRKYVVSSFIYNKGGGGAQVFLTYKQGTNTIEKTPALISTDNDLKNTWLTKTGSFIAPNGTDFRLRIKSNANFVSYFDDIKIDPALNVKCSNPTKDIGNCSDPEAVIKPSYLASSCRLYPTADALDCLHTDSNNITHKGVKGYCLEKDPKNPSTCLMWYPLDKIASDSTEEGVGVSFQDPLYYCDYYTPEPRYAYHIDRYNGVTDDDNGDECSTNNPCKGVLYCDRQDGYSCDSDNDYVYNCIRFDNLSGMSRIPDNEELKRNEYTSSTGKILPNPANDFGWKCGNKASVSITNSFICPRITNSTNTTCNVVGEIVWRHFDEAVYYDHCAQFNNTCKSLTANFDQLKNPRYYCSRVVKVNETKPWATRLRNNSSFAGVTCYTFPNNVVTNSICQYAADSAPYGSAYLVGQDINRDPKFWDPSIGNPSGAESRGNALVWKPINSGQRMGATIANDTVSGYYTPNLFYASQVGAQPANTFIAQTSGKCNGNGAACSSDADCGWQRCVISYGDLSSSSKNEVACANGLRPAYNNNSPRDSYCYIVPKILNFKMKGISTNVYVSGSEDITISFETKTDAEQLPLKNISLDLDYKNSSGSQATVSMNGRYGDATRYIKQTFSYTDINISQNSNKCASAYQTVNLYGVTCGAKACCVVQPKVSITDNWGYSSSLSNWPGAYVVVQQE